MTASRLFEDRKDEEFTVTADGAPSEGGLKDVLKKISEILFQQRAYERWKSDLESRRHPPDHTPEPGYEHRYRENEGNSEPAFRMGNYQEGPPSWQQWIVKIVAGLLVTGIPAVIWELSLINSKLSFIVATQEAQSERIKALEERTSRLETKVFQ